MFIRQTARCPYLVESEEFSIFVKPSQVNLQRELSLLPRLSPENMLVRIQQYFSFIGNITNEAIEDQENQILEFYNKATDMFAFLEQFKKHIDYMEQDFEHAVMSS